MPHDLHSRSRRSRWPPPACGSSSRHRPPARARRPAVRLALDWYPNPDHVGIYTAIYHGDFARAGLNVTPLPPANVSDPMKLIAAGRADIGISYEPELFFAQQQDPPVVAVASIVPTALNSIITTRRQGITTPAGLGAIHRRGRQRRARRLSRHRAAAQRPDPENDVHRVNVGFNLRAGAAVRPASTRSPAASRTSRARSWPPPAPHPVVFPVDRYGVPGYDELVVVVNREKLQTDAGYRPRSRAFVSALRAGTAYARRTLRRRWR